MMVEQVGSRYIARVSYENREIAKQAGFRWDPDGRQWYTKDPAVAAKLAEPDAVAKLQAEAQTKRKQTEAAIVASRAATADVEIPCPEGLAYLPYQRAGIATAVSRPNVLFGDEMGLGKTIQAIGLINADESLRKILVVCPASLKLNWQREINKWSVRKLTIAHATGSSFPGSADVVIINYDILAKHAQAMRAIAWDLIVADEAHFAKNPDAKRTIALFGCAQTKKRDYVLPVNARRKVLLTGTPIPNRPIEGFGLFKFLDSKNFGSFLGYARRYCAAIEGRHGWDFSGSSNLAELQDKLRGSIMIRRLKADVLTELPAKRRSIIEIPASGAAARAVEAETEAFELREEQLLALRARVELAKASADPNDYAEAVASLTEAVKQAFTDLARMRKATAVAKIPFVIAHLCDLIEDGSKVVVFAHHHDVIKALEAEFGSKAVSLYGEVAMATRQANVDRFQTDPTCKVFIGGILAAGVGITLTAASQVVFAELDWVPGNVTQAEDRCHRIGQRDMVNVQHLVLEGSIDARMAAVLVDKQEVLAAALDTERAEVEPVIAPVKEKPAATDRLTRPVIEKEAVLMTEERKVAILQGLQMLAGMCDGARELDGSGFNKLDTRIGQQLAYQDTLTDRQAVLGAKLVNRYRRQLPTALVATAAGKE